MARRASSGPPKPATTTAGPCATPARSATTPLSRAPPAATPTRNRPPSRSASLVRPNGEASTPPPAKSSSETAPTGSGIWPASSFPTPSKSSTSTTPSNICPTPPRPSTEPEPTKPTPGPGSAITSWTTGGCARSWPNCGPHAKTSDEARRCIEYFVRNRHRMHYPRFRARGLCVASGVVEAGCKHVVGDRLKRAGMRWTLAGANAIIALRCCQLSARFEDFWERRAPDRGTSQI